MRDIKFRAWCKLENKWLEPDQGDSDWPMLLAIGLHGLPICIDKDSIKQGEVVGWNRDHNIELVQFAGFADKNGVDIYDGDIFGGFEREVLSWDNQYQRYCIKIKNRRSGWLTEFKSKHREVIGNIYENPELLEVNNG